MMPTNFFLKTSLEIFFIAMELYAAVPLGIAVYPQQGMIKASELEPEFRNILDGNGNVMREFYFNKGL